MSITTIRPHKAKRIAPEPKCGRTVTIKHVTFRCDLPADHLPAYEHAALVRWTPPNPTAAPRKHRHVWVIDPVADHYRCNRCPAIRDEARARRGRTARTRGNREELTVAREVGGRKVGPMGWPWDVTMDGYARLQVKKLANPPSLRFIAAELARIAATPGPEQPGFVWVEPGRGGERLIVFRLSDFSERHGIPEVGE